MRPAGILFSDFGPYHVARIEALARSLADAGRELVAFRFTERSDTYGWSPVLPRGVETVTLADRYPTGAGEAWRLARRFRGELRRRGLGVVFLPTYAPLPNLLCLLAAKSAGCRAVLMTESWLGTEQAGHFGRLAKHLLVRMFDSALVGGTPQVDFVAAYGMPREKIFTGYDVVDTDFFSARADEVRAAAEKSVQCSEDGFQDGEAKSSALASAIAALGLPERFFLNLGRFVEKKNLATLVSAYARFCDAWRVASHEGKASAPPSLVLVGEGPLRGDLERQARELGLRVMDGARARSQSPGVGLQEESSDHAANSKLQTANSVEQHGTVLFYGFQQSDMTPVFFALCEAFILPSRREEWGLVVNEAMACSAPVVVSSRVGAGFDLVEHGVNGLRFDPDDVAGLVDAMLEVAKDAGVRSRYGAAGRARIASWTPARFGESGRLAVDAAGVS